MYFWLFWIPITYYLARARGITGIIIAHFIIATSILLTDVVSATETINDHEAINNVDLDAIFALGILIRVFIVNIVLLPLSIIGYFLKKKEGK